MNAGELVISLVLNTTLMMRGIRDVRSGLGDVGDAGQDAGRDLEDAADRGIRGFGDLLPVLGKVAAALGGIALVQGWASNYVSEAIRIKETSQGLGMSMRELQGWEGAAREAGLEADSLRDALHDMSDYMYDLALHDSGPLKDATEDLGVSIKDTKGEVKDLTQFYLEFADAMQQADPQKATAIGKQLSLDPQMITLLQKGGENLDALIKKHKELAIYNKRDAETATQVRRAWELLGNSWEGIKAIVMRYLMPAIQWIIDKVGELVDWARKNETSIKVIFTTIAAVIAMVVTPALWGMAKAGWAAIAPWLPFIAAIAAVILVLDDFVHWLETGNGALSDLWEVFGTHEEVAERLRKAWEGLKAIWEGVVDIVIALTRLIGNLLRGDVDAAKRAADAFGAAWMRVFGVLSDAAAWLGEKIAGILPDWAKELLGIKGGGKVEISGPAPATPTIDPATYRGAAPLVDPLDMAGQPDQSARLARLTGATGAGGTSTKTVNSSTNISQITVQTQATDAQGIAQSIDGAIRNVTAQSDSAYGR